MTATDIDTEVTMPELEDHDAGPVALVPDFEGREVVGAHLKIQGQVSPNERDLVVGVDDRIRLVIVCRVTNVSHNVNSDGDLERLQVAKVVSAERVPFSEGVDDGIVRA